MKATMSLQKINGNQTTTGKPIIQVFVKNVEVGSEIENLLISLGYISLGWNQYRADATTPAELDKVRMPLIELYKNGQIEA